MKINGNSVKIVFGALLIFLFGVNLAGELKAQTNTAQLAGFLTMGILMLLLGFYLVYRGLYPREK